MTEQNLSKPHTSKLVLDSLFVVIFANFMCDNLQYVHVCDFIYKNYSNEMKMLGMSCSFYALVIVNHCISKEHTVTESMQLM